MNNDEKMMKRALELASNGRGFTAPNPMVGAVIVKDGKIIGEGYHKKAGEAHAEVNAIESASESVEGATLYVTLEPCSHFGKTPPCSELIIDRKIKKVVIAATDPNSLVSGSGIKQLRQAGIEVVTGIYEKESHKLNEVFNYYITTKLPYVVMKYAMSLDGKIATETGESKWITSQDSRQHARYLRAHLSGIMVGINTVLKDDPELTCRVPAFENPTRIILDSRLRIPLDAKVLSHQQDAPTIILTTSQAPSAKLDKLKGKHIEVLVLPDKNGQVDLKEAMKILGEKGIDSLLLEGGGTVNASALSADIVNKLAVYIAPILIGGDGAPSPVMGKGIQKMSEVFKLNNMDITRIRDDMHIEAYIDRRNQ
ncbi:bifunctional diaminohydroxyphosphoribosylaminopyrimidine deaminase/5-amino-6-(5-phosphoribosylamino)uracil reductase RibD [Alkalibacterium olivapovliticus]|uniref:Riboflavin biosynthesis protein RibD n=1 Tax=Alkalibacterium olivapovliticus TaxID=99907 RepID=A0A2T0W8K1_9LACT|nr:bifunctional diaminohydroxyphosphoribosylaminopyrimidine deaminase/5-amino-6-(5-phosphoribosylamino)uracil reductase RibD [Alkalibacterium olivapovliticus]PRY83009.1 diaminohydroxyphosphoribosylaminopyrimidine deaminase/5-amino-6-(5-phosphoribosylamino)uracil reductase [Alkalibacterium olivapovliticus]